MHKDIGGIISCPSNVRNRPIDVSTKKEVNSLIMFKNLQGAFAGSKNQEMTFVESDSIAKVEALAQREAAATSMSSPMARILPGMAESTWTCIAN